MLKQPVFVAYLAVVAGLLMLAIVVISIFHGGESREDFDGEWSADDGPVKFESVIVDDQIVIDLNFEGVGTGLYWAGTFEFDGELEEGDVVLSIPDESQLQWSMFGSLADDKEFRYNGDSLEFDFSIMGVDGVAELQD